MPKTAVSLEGTYIQRVGKITKSATATPGVYSATRKSSSNGESLLPTQHHDQAQHNQHKHELRCHLPSNHSYRRRTSQNSVNGRIWVVLRHGVQADKPTQHATRNVVSKINRWQYIATTMTQQNRSSPPQIIFVRSHISVPSHDIEAGMIPDGNYCVVH